MTTTFARSRKGPVIRTRPKSHVDTRTERVHDTWDVESTAIATWRQRGAPRYIELACQALTSKKEKAR